MEDAPFKRKGRWFQAVLVMSITFCAMLSYIAPSILMGDIMQTFGASQETAGLAMSVQLAMFGVCMFIGSFITDRFGKTNTLKLGMCCVFAGTLISYFAPNMTIFIIARVISGFGQGMTVCGAAQIATWFEGKERSLAVTLMSMGSMVAIAISVAVSRPLATALGKWQNVWLVYAAFSVIFVVLWLVFGKDSPEGIEMEKQQKETAAATGKKQSSLGLAVKDPQSWYLMIYFLFFTVIDTVRATFLPSYLVEVGVGEKIMTVAMSLLSIVGMAGSLIGGILVTKIWRRKPLLYIGVVGYIICGLLLTVFHQSLPAAIFTILLGFFYNIPLTANTMLMIEYGMSENPQMIPGMGAMMSGVGLLMTLAVSPVYTSLSASMGSTGAFRVSFIALIVSFIMIFFRKETGIKPEATPVDVVKE